jgi:Protein of unknown function (DUF4058)
MQDMGAPKNPFPGMNPYLEQRWGDVHAALVTYARDLLQEVLPDDLRARMQERVFIETEAGSSGAPRSIYPDVHVYEQPRGRAGGPAAGSAAVAEPVLIHLPAAEITESYIEIVDARSGGRVVTVIEFISRANKVPGPGRDLYLRKQTDAQRASANLVEIDLLRGGQSVSLALPDLVPPGYKAAYHASVFRASAPTRLEYYKAPLRETLPTIGIPLRATDPDAALKLQDLVDLAYQRGKYDDIDYVEPLRPSLAPDDAAWVETILRTAGLN